jgi:hypothetical protein
MRTSGIALAASSLETPCGTTEKLDPNNNVS